MVLLKKTNCYGLTQKSLLEEGIQFYLGREGVENVEGGIQTFGKIVYIHHPIHKKV